MSIYAKVALISVMVLFLALWNFRRAKRLGRIYLGGVDYARADSPKGFKFAIFMNCIWSVLLLLLLLFCVLKVTNVIH